MSLKEFRKVCTPLEKIYQLKGGHSFSMLPEHIQHTLLPAVRNPCSSQSIPEKQASTFLSHIIFGARLSGTAAIVSKLSLSIYLKIIKKKKICRMQRRRRNSGLGYCF